MVSWTEDQAEGLRKLFAKPPRPVVVFLGVTPEDSAMAAALCMKNLSERGEPTVVIDEVGTAMGCYGLGENGPRKDLADVIEKKVSINEVLLSVSDRACVLPAARAIRGLAGMTSAHRKAAASILRGVEKSASVTLVATAEDAGIASPFLTGATRIVLCTSFDPSGLRVGYQLLKRLRTVAPARAYGLVLTRAAEGGNIGPTVNNFCAVAKGAMGVGVEWIASISGPNGAWAKHFRTDQDHIAAKLIGDDALYTNGSGWGQVKNV